MQKLSEAAEDFLAQPRVAVTGVSRNSRGHGSNAVYKRLRERGYQVFAVNPNADRVEAALGEALATARARGLSGKELTPFLLGALDRSTAGESRAANVELLRRNARVAGEIARELARG